MYSTVGSREMKKHPLLTEVVWTTEFSPVSKATVHHSFQESHFLLSRPVRVQDREIGSLEEEKASQTAVILCYNSPHEEHRSSKPQGNRECKTGGFKLLLCPMNPDQIIVKLFRARGHQLQYKPVCH